MLKKFLWRGRYSIVAPTPQNQIFLEIFIEKRNERPYFEARTEVKNKMKNERKKGEFGQEMRRLVLVFFEELRRRITSGFQAMKYSLFGHKEKVSSIDIHGDRAFCEAVKQALMLLKEKDLPTFNLIDRHLIIIVQSGETLLDPHRDGAALALEGKRAKEVTETWLACEAFGAKLYQDYVTQNKRRFRVPTAVYYNDKTWDFMYECLKKMGGTYEETQHLADFIKEEREKQEKEER